MMDYNLHTLFKRFDYLELKKRIDAIWYAGVRQSAATDAIEGLMLTMLDGMTSSKIRSAIFEPEYATMAVTQKDLNDTNPANTMALLAHPSGSDVMNPPADPVLLEDLNTDGNGLVNYGGFYKVTGWELDAEVNGFSLSGNDLICESNEGGLYLIPVGWGDFRHSANNATATFVLGIEGDTHITFSQRPTGNKHPNLEDIRNISGGGKVRLYPNQKLSVWVAVDVAGNLTLGNANVSVLKIAK